MHDLDSARASTPPAANPPAPPGPQAVIEPLDNMEISLVTLWRSYTANKHPEERARLLLAAQTALCKEHIGAAAEDTEEDAPAEQST